MISTGAANQAEIIPSNNINPINNFYFSPFFYHFLSYLTRKTLLDFRQTTS